MISAADKAIWLNDIWLNDMSRHMLDPTIPWQPKTATEEAIVALVEKGKIVDSGQRRRGRSGKLQIVWIAKELVRRA
jgi:hypothetical protein